jgi:hypothetical protein
VSDDEKADAQAELMTSKPLSDPTPRLMTCKICENTQDNKTFKTREMMFGSRKWFLYFHCAKCGCLQIAEFPSNIFKYYPANYYSYTESSSEQFNNPIKNIFKKMRARYAIWDKGVIGRILYAKFPNEFARRSLSGVADLRKNTRYWMLDAELAPCFTRSKRTTLNIYWVLTLFLSKASNTKMG